MAGALTLTLGLGGCALLAQDAGPAPDPANPLQLNEAAVARVAQGDLDTGWLLLERAAQLAPHDARIAANLAALREYRGAATRGRVVTAFAPGARPAPARPARASLAQPPALWAAPR